MHKMDGKNLSIVEINGKESWAKEAEEKTFTYIYIYKQYINISTYTHIFTVYMCA